MKKLLLIIIFPLLLFCLLAMSNNVKAEILWNDIDNDGWNEYLNVGETIIDYDLGGMNSAVITSEGRVFTWGANNVGQLGDNSVLNKRNPTEITNNFNLNIGEKITKIIMGGFTNSAISSEGRIYTWGSGYVGQLGDGVWARRSMPEEITESFDLYTEEKITNVLISENHSAAMTSKGRIFIWGWISTEYDGETIIEYYDFPLDITEWFNLSVGEIVNEISLGSYHSVAVTSKGRVFTWGANYNGQLGNGERTAYYDVPNRFPTEITNQFSLRIEESIIHVSGGDKHSAAITSAGRIFTWGNNSYGQLGGEPFNYDVTYPIDITDNFRLLENEIFAEVSLGSNHSAAITSEGRVFMWGNNESGELGDGTFQYKLEPIDITSNFNLDIEEKIVSVNLGSIHSSAVTSSGKIFTWGNNDDGQLGDNTLTEKNLPTEITNKFSYHIGETISEVVLGWQHSISATYSGKIFTWGNNGSGRLGNGDSNNEFTPIEISDQFYLNNGETIQKFDYGDKNSAAITSEGRLFTWGYNTEGGLGDGTSDNRNIPTEITNNFNLDIGETITEVDIGTRYSLATTSTGKLFTWGSEYKSNEYGVIEPDWYTPREITNQFPLNVGEKIINIYSGNRHHAALTSEGRLFSWGYNEYGQLGDGTTIGRYDDLNPNPIEITGNFNLNAGECLLDVSLGSNHSSTLTSEGRLFMWGNNDDGQLGDGTNIDKSLPIEITTNFSLNIEETIVKVDLGYYHSSIVTSEGRVFMWGDNSEGQLGDRTNTDKNLPYEITGNFNLNIEETIVGLDLGGAYSSAFTSLGRIFTWGDNNQGQLGDNTLLDKNVPTEITHNFELDFPSYDRIYLISKRIDFDIDSQTVEIQILLDYPSEIYSVICNDTEVTNTSVIENVLIFNMPVSNITYGDTYSIYISELNYNDGTSVPTFGNVYSDSVVIDNIPPTFEIENQTIESGEYTSLEPLIINIVENCSNDLIYSEPGVQMDYITPGVYTVTIRLSDESGNFSEQEVTITVEDTTAPVIYLTGDSTIYLTYGEDYIEKGATCSDNFDVSGDVIVGGDIVDSTEIGTYIVTYNITDSEGNVADEVTRTVVVQDIILLSATLKPGIDSISLGSTYFDPGITVVDVEETTTVIIGTVNTNVVGTYVLTYTVTNSSGHEISIDRYITVYENPTIQFELGKAKTTLLINEKYVDGTCSVLVNGLTKACDIKSSNLNTSIEGVYTITYLYEYNEVEYTYNRYIFVRNKDMPLTLYYRKEEEGIFL